MAWVEILPSFEAFFRRRGMESAAAFLGWTGILVNHHRHRQVEQVALPATLACAAGLCERFFLKKEYGVSWRTRFRNAWAGFGWCSTAVREGAMLQALRRAGVVCPEVAALGEDGKHAFVLLREEPGLSDLRTLLQELRCEADRRRLAAALGRELARLHDAGFDHPDLFARHVLAGRAAGGFRFCILDWQRSRYRRRVPWNIRTRDLAVLDATLLDLLANDRSRLYCLRAYLRATRAEKLPPGRLAKQIRREADNLRNRRRIREAVQLPTPAGDQAFVPLRDGRLLIVRSFADRLSERWPDTWRKRTDDAAHVWDLLSAFAAAAGMEAVLLNASPDDADDRPIPRLAHVLFRLQRFGVPAPRLLAVDGGHLLTGSAKAIPFAETFAKAPIARRRRLLESAGVVIRRIHEAGYRLPSGDSWMRRLGVVSASGAVMLANVEALIHASVPWQQLAPVEFHDPELRLSRSEQLRFLRGYLGTSRLRAAERQAAA